jgi:hypothetical protein
MKKLSSIATLEKFGRIRISKHIFMRDFLYSEISNFFGIPNLPQDPDLAVKSGTKLATELLGPIVETFGPISVRFSYRSPEEYKFGNEKGHSCARLKPISSDRTLRIPIWEG